jgi:tetratricopeptide (TPR) repeat protein
MNSLAILLVDRGRIDEAIELYKKVIEIKPSLGEVRYNYANALVAQKKYKEAIPLYEAAVKLKPDLADAHCDLALLLATCPDPTVRDGAKAVACARRAAELTEWPGAPVRHGPEKVGPRQDDSQPSETVRGRHTVP